MPTLRPLLLALLFAWVLPGAIAPVQAQTPPAAISASGLAGPKKNVPPSVNIKELREAAWNAVRQKDWLIAIELWSQILNQQADDSEALRLRASSHAEIGHRDQALADARRATELAPEDTHNWNSLCWVHLLLGEFPSARAACEKSVNLEARVYNQINLGHTWLLGGHSAEAQRWYAKSISFIDDERSLKDGPLRDFEIFIERGWRVEASRQAHAWFAEEGGRWLERKLPMDQLVVAAKTAEAKKDYARAISLRKQQLPMLVELYGEGHPRIQDAESALIDTIEQQADQFFKTNRTAEALPLFRRVLAYREKQPKGNANSKILSLFNLGAALTALEQNQEAERYLQRAIGEAEQEFGKEHEITILLVEKQATLYANVGRFEEALQLSLRALPLREKQAATKPEKFSSNLLTAALNAEKANDLHQAKSLWERYLAVAPKDANAHASLSRVLRKLGEYESALSAITLAAELAPSDAGKWLDFCALLNEHNRPLDARPYCEKALSIEGQDFALEAKIVLGHTYLLAGDLVSAQHWYRQTMTMSEYVINQNNLFAVFDLFINKGFKPELVRQAKAWFAQRLEPLLLADQQITLVNQKEQNGDMAGAIAANRKALDTFSMALGKNDARSIGAMDSLARKLKATGQAREAGLLDKQVRQTRGWSTLELDHNTAVVNSAQTLLAAGQKEDASRRLAARDAVLWQDYRAAKRKKSTAADYDPARPIAHYYGEILAYGRGLDAVFPRQDLAKHLDELAITDRKATSPKSLQSSSTILHFIGRFHYADQDLASARKAWRISVDFAEASKEGNAFPPLIWLGHSYFNENRLDEALDYYRQSSTALGKLNAVDNASLFDETVIAQSTLQALQNAGLGDRVVSTAADILAKLQNLSLRLPQQSKPLLLQALIDLDRAVSGGRAEADILKEKITDQGLMLAETLDDPAENRRWTLAFLWNKEQLLRGDPSRRLERIGTLERMTKLDPENDEPRSSPVYYNEGNELAWEYQAQGDEDAAARWAETGYAAALKTKDASSFQNALQLLIRGLYKKGRLDDVRQRLLEAAAQGIDDAFVSSLLAIYHEKNGEYKEALELRLKLLEKVQAQPASEGEWHTPEERNLLALYSRQHEWSAVRALVAKHLAAPGLEKMSFSHVALLEWVADLDEQLGNRESAGRLRDKARQIHQETALESEKDLADRPALRAQLASFGGGMWFSPNERWILTANNEGNKLDLWHRDTGRRLGSIFPKHTMSAATFLPDNRLVLATVSGTLELWDTKSLQFKQQIYAHTGRIDMLSVSPDGKRLLSYDLNRIRLWQTDTLEAQGGVQPPWVANNLIWLDNEYWLGCDGNADTIFRFSSKGLQQEARTNGCHSLQALGAGQAMYLNNMNQPEVRNGGNLEANEGLYRLDNVLGSGHQLKVSGTIVVLSGSEKITTWRISGKTLLPGPGLTGNKIVQGISPDSRWLYYSSEENPGQIEALALADRDGPANPFKSSGIQTLGLEFSESGRELWVRTANDIRVWNLETGSVSKQASMPSQRSPASASLPPKSTLLWASGRRAKLHWDQQAGVPLIGSNLWGNAKGFGLQRNAEILPDGDLLTLRSPLGGDEVVRWQGDSSQARWYAAVDGGASEIQFLSVDGNHFLVSSINSNNQISVARIDSRTGGRTETKGLPPASAIGLAPSPSGKAWGISVFENKTSYLQLNAKADAVDAIEPLPLTACAVSRAGRCEVRSARNAPVIAFAEFVQGWVVIWLMRPELPPGDKNRLVQGYMGRPMRDFALSADGRFLAVLDANGRIDLNSAVSGEHLGQLLMFDNDEWVVMDANQRFDGTRAGDIQSVHWVVGMEPVALNQLKERYYEPGLVGKLTGFNKEPLRPVAEFTTPKLYPEVKLEAEPNKPLVTQVRLLDQGGGIGRVQILLNGKEIEADARGATLAQNAAKATLSVDLEGLPLRPGEENVLEVVVWNNEGYLASRGAKRVITGPAAAEQAPPTLYAIVSGISEYANPQINLNFSGKDATDIARALQLAGKRLFGVDHVEISLLTDIPGNGALLPTRKNLQEAFANVAKRAKHNDLLVVYLAGHGAMSPGKDSDYYYLTRDARSTDLTDPEVRDTYGVSSAQMTEWIKSIPSLKQVMVLDTCAAGGAVEKLTQARSLSSDQVRALDRLKDRTGFHVLMGASADKVSYESSQFGQGLLTYAILQGMKGAALRDGEYLDVQTLFQHAADQVPRMAQSIGGIQRPIIASPRGTSFDIGQLKNEDKIEIPLASIRPMFIRSIFQDEIKPVDSLGLGRTINSLFRNLTANAHGSPIVFIDSDDLPDAFQLAGRYQRKGDQLEIRANIYRGQNELAEFSLTGDLNNTEKTSCRLIEAALKSVLKEKDKELRLSESACR